MSDLDDSILMVLVRRPHLLGVIYGERHRLFLVDVLPGFERGERKSRLLQDIVGLLHRGMSGASAPTV